MALLTPQSGGATDNDNIRRLGPRRPTPVAPGGPIIGDLWYNTTDLTLRAWNGSIWQVIGGSESIMPPARVGPSPVGAYGSGYASFDHTGRAYTSPNNYVLLADVTNSFLNAPAGGGVFLRIANSTRVSVTDGGVITYGAAAAEVLVADTNTVRSNYGFSMPQLANLYLRGFGDTNHRIIVPAVALTHSTAFNVDGPVIVGFNNWILATGSNTHWQQCIYANGIQIYGKLGVGNGTSDNVVNNFESITLGNAGSGITMSQRSRVADDQVNRVVIYANNDEMYFWQNSDMVRFAQFGNVHIPMDLPNLGAATAVVFTNGGGSRQLGINTSSGKHKENIKTLKNTSDLDSGQHNPVFKMRPVRFTWKQREYHGGPGVVDAKTMNDLHPNGVTGLIAEEVREVAPDAALVIPAKPEWHYNPDTDPKPELDYHGEPILYRPAIPETVQSVDNDRLIAYLIDAVQHLKEELDNLKEKFRSEDGK